MGGGIYLYPKLWVAEVSVLFKESFHVTVREGMRQLQRASQNLTVGEVVKNS